MFSSAFVALVLASAAFAGPAKRDGGLSVNISGPSNVATVDDLKFSATVKNSGSEDVKVLKYGTILDSLPTRSFTITKDGETVPFTGVKLSVSLEAAGEDAYTVIPAGQSVTVEHDVSALFDFATTGAGNYKFEPVANFQVIGSANSFAESLEALEPVEVQANAVELALPKVDKKELIDNEKRAVLSCSDSTKASFISSSYSEGKQLASVASSWISSNSGSSLYTAYWKTNSATTIRGVFNNVANENSSSRILGCTDPAAACSGGVIAYTIISNTNIYFCSIFFNEVAQTRLCSGTTVASRNVRGGTVLHEITHATSGTDDVTYGCAADQALSAANQRANADNYNCFATQVWQNTQC